MRISCDKTINGEDFHSLEPRSSHSLNFCILTLPLGHSFVIVPFSMSKEGFKDAEQDDWTDESHWLQKLQRVCINVRGDAWD